MIKYKCIKIKRRGEEKIWKLRISKAGDYYLICNDPFYKHSPQDAEIWDEYKETPWNFELIEQWDGDRLIKEWNGVDLNKLDKAVERVYKFKSSLDEMRKDESKCFICGIGDLDNEPVLNKKDGGPGPFHEFCFMKAGGKSLKIDKIVQEQQTFYDIANQAGLTCEQADKIIELMANREFEFVMPNGSRIKFGSNPEEPSLEEFRRCGKTGTTAAAAGIDIYAEERQTKESARDLLTDLKNLLNVFRGQNHGFDQLMTAFCVIDKLLAREDKLDEARKIVESLQKALILEQASGATLDGFNIRGKREPHLLQIEKLKELLDD